MHSGLLRLLLVEKSLQLISPFVTFCAFCVQVNEKKKSDFHNDLMLLFCNSVKVDFPFKPQTVEGVSQVWSRGSPCAH